MYNFYVGMHVVCLYVCLCILCAHKIENNKRNKKSLFLYDYQVTYVVHYAAVKLRLVDRCMERKYFMRGMKMKMYLKLVIVSESFCEQGASQTRREDFYLNGFLLKMYEKRVFFFSLLSFVLYQA